MAHALDQFGGTGIGFGKSFRGVIRTRLKPVEDQVLFGGVKTLHGYTSLRTSLVQKILTLGEAVVDDEAVKLWLIETINSVYVVQQFPE